MRVIAKEPLSTSSYKELLKETGKTEMDVARLVGVGAATVQRWSSGRTRVPWAVVILLRLVVSHPELLELIEGYASEDVNS